jgi:hypothetical protein
MRLTGSTVYRGKVKVVDHNCILYSVNIPSSGVREIQIINIIV